MCSWKYYPDELKTAMIWKRATNNMAESEFGGVSQNIVQPGLLVILIITKAVISMSSDYLVASDGNRCAGLSFSGLSPL